MAERRTGTWRVAQLAFLLMLAAASDAAEYLDEEGGVVESAEELVDSFSGAAPLDEALAGDEAAEEDEAFTEAIGRVEDVPEIADQTVLEPEPPSTADAASDPEALPMPPEPSDADAPPPDDAVLAPTSLFSAIRGTRVRFAARSYGIERSGNGEPNAEALAAGGKLSLLTRPWHGLRLGGAYYVSQRLDAGSFADRSGLFGRNGEDIDVFGTAYLRYERDDLRLQLYRQEISLPYLNRDDTRMLPNTFEAYTLSQEGGQLEWVVGHVAEMKPKADEDFRHMAAVAGADSDEGLSIIGGRYHLAEGTNVAALVLESHELFRTTYFEAHRLQRFGENTQLKLSLQATDQRSIGDELLGDFDTWAVGARAIGSYRGVLVTGAYTAIGPDAQLLSPYGGTPSYNNLMIRDFDRVGEQAAQLGLSWSLTRLGIKGVGFSMRLVQGWGAEDADTGRSLPDRHEMDLSLAYQPREGRLEGLRLRLRYAQADDSGPGGSATQIRLIADYTFGLR